MAQKVTTTLVDDLDDTPIEDGKGRTVQFGFDGADYEIDLNDNNVDKLRDALSDYIAAARKTSSRRTTGSSRGGSRTSGRSSDKNELAAIRTWAKENGHNVSERGRISQTVRDAYDAAH
ncbi:Lsr2 family protein [Curtobacterium sp. MCBD17_040]|uniref:histone-like nucleoid-structuring protein Lsr2 n=1 Tax=Curtobacterium sp. MCBD17_040 TaxID=2175674 RepID=UPI000DAA8EC3|nr:Lsr2 family protein [Curtobacterium sp. MCBD17_040]WIB65539.1 Lsr2 family protein [Curtobacterium sp. MCBD17_040]